jgi:galactokinase
LEIYLNKLYGSDKKIIAYQNERYNKLLSSFEKIFGKSHPGEIKFFSSPGRTEISGNHTDHNHGKVIAASINLDSVACVLQSDSKVELYSEGYDKTFIVNLETLKPVKEEAGTTSALIRGTAAGFRKHGFNIGGFKACITSDVLPGSGLSSSASIEVLIGTIFNHLYNEGKISPVDIAKIGQYAENEFFKKPCGLMDQVACAVGGIVAIDFIDPEEPEIEKINFDFSATGYSLLVVDTGGSHSDLTEDYSSIPAEMKQVAKYFNKDFCRGLDLDSLLKSMKDIRRKMSDRSVLRAIHFIKENERVERQTKALKENNFEKFLNLVNESGNSSYKYLQNIFSSRNVEEQGVSLALALSDLFTKEKGKGACRVHGGGFAGTIQVFLPNDLVDEYKHFISNVFDKDAVKVLSIRNQGTMNLTSPNPIKRDSL